MVGWQEIIRRVRPYSPENHSLHAASRQGTCIWEGAAGPCPNKAEWSVETVTPSSNWFAACTEHLHEKLDKEGMQFVATPR